MKLCSSWLLKSHKDTHINKHSCFSKYLNFLRIAIENFHLFCQPTKEKDGEIKTVEEEETY
jgi:hypothetical protein